MQSSPTRATLKRKPAKVMSVLKEVRKRDGTIVPFDRERIKSALQRAMHASGEGNGEEAEKDAH